MRFVRRFARWDAKVVAPVSTARASVNAAYTPCGHLNQRLRIRCLRAKGHRTVHANGLQLW